MKLKSTRILCCIALFFTVSVKAQNNAISSFFPKIEVLASNNPAEGHYFMGSKGLTAANASHYIAIIDNYGTPVFFRKMNKATSSFCLLPNGKLAYLHGVPRKWYLLNDLLEIEKILEIDGFKPNGHDWDFDNNGHLLLLGEASRNFDMSTLVEGGKENAEILDLIVQEFDDDFELLYTWNSADHFNILDGNEQSQYLDFTESQIDYIHTNAISVDTDTSFLISNRHMDEISKIDRRTGEIIWRLGGKKNEFTFVNDEIRFSHQHSIRSLGNGNILLFDNGNQHNPQISSAVEYAINESEKTATLVKRYYRNPNVYSNHQGTTQRVHNGNTIMNWGPYWPSLTEFHPNGEPALEWDFTKHSFCPRIEKYVWETKIFETDLTEINFGIFQNDTLFQNLWIKNNSPGILTITTLDKHTDYFGIDEQLPVNIASGDSLQTKIWYFAGSMQTGKVWDVLTLASDSENQRIARQIKVTGEKLDNITPQAQLKSQTTDFPLNEKIEIEFSEPVRFGSNDIHYNNIDSFLQIKDISSNENVLFYAAFSTDKKTISIRPVTPLKNNASYQIILDGVNDYAGNSLEKFEAIISTVTSVQNDFGDENVVYLFPNPAKNKLFIETTQLNANLNYRIYLLSGELMFKKQLKQVSKEEINISGYKPGIYFIHIEAGKNNIVKRFIKY